MPNNFIYYCRNIFANGNNSSVASFIIINRKWDFVSDINNFTEIKLYSEILYQLIQWSSNCGARPPGGGEVLDRGAQQTFLQIKIKTALNELKQ
jgi:hypothetical protein